MTKRKKLFILTTYLMLLCFILNGCTIPKTYPTQPQVPAIPDYSSYVTLCDYRNLTYDINEGDYIVTEELIDRGIYQNYYSVIVPQPITTQAIQNGDTVTMSVDCKINDVSVYWTESNEYTLGNHAKSEIFDNHIIGQHVGDKITFSYEYPANYEDPTYAGRTANYTMVILSATTKYVPIDDTFATSYTEYSSAEALRTAMREFLTNNAAEIRKEEIFADYIDQIITNSTYSEIPNYDVFVNDIRTSHNNNATSLGLTAEQYYSQYFSMSTTDYETSLNEFATKYLKTRMAICEIARREGITVTQEEYNAYIQTFLQQAGVNSLSEVNTQLDMSVEVLIDLLMPKVMDKLIELNTQ